MKKLLKGSLLALAVASPIYLLFFYTNTKEQKIEINSEVSSDYIPTGETFKLSQNSDRISSETLDEFHKQSNTPSDNTNLSQIDLNKHIGTATLNNLVEHYSDSINSAAKVKRYNDSIKLVEETKSLIKLGISASDAKKYMDLTKSFKEVQRHNDSIKSIAELQGYVDSTKYVAEDTLTGKNIYKLYVAEKVTPVSVTLAGYKGYTGVNTITKEEIENTLIKNGLVEIRAEKYSSTIYKFLNNKYFKRVSIFATATGAALTTEELLFPNLPFWKRVIIALGFGVLILILYIKLSNKGIMK